MAHSGPHTPATGEDSFGLIMEVEHGGAVVVLGSVGGLGVLSGDGREFGGAPCGF